eukprot:gene8386-10301_t
MTTSSSSSSSSSSNTGSMLPVDIQQDITSFENILDKLETQLEPFFKISLKEHTEKLSPLESAKLNITIAYALNSLFFTNKNLNLGVESSPMSLFVNSSIFDSPSSNKTLDRSSLLLNTSTASSSTPTNTSISKLAADSKHPLDSPSKLFLHTFDFGPNSYSKSPQLIFPTMSSTTNSSSGTTTINNSNHNNNSFDNTSGNESLIHSINNGLQPNGTSSSNSTSYLSSLIPDQNDKLLLSFHHSPKPSFMMDEDRITTPSSPSHHLHHLHHHPSSPPHTSTSTPPQITTTPPTLNVSTTTTTTTNENTTLHSITTVLPQQQQQQQQHQQSFVNNNNHSENEHDDMLMSDDSVLSTGSSSSQQDHNDKSLSDSYDDSSVDQPSVSPIKAHPSPSPPPPQQPQFTNVVLQTTPTVLPPSTSISTTQVSGLPSSISLDTPQIPTTTTTTTTTPIIIPDTSLKKRKKNADDGGRWCHQCKALKYQFIQCQALELGKPRCNKRFCSTCLLKHYGKEVAVLKASDTPWECPFCLNTCICAACKRKRGAENSDNPQDAPPRMPRATPNKGKSTPKKKNSTTTTSTTTGDQQMTIEQQNLDPSNNLQVVQNLDVTVNNVLQKEFEKTNNKKKIVDVTMNDEEEDDEDSTTTTTTTTTTPPKKLPKQRKPRKLIKMKHESAEDFQQQSGTEGVDPTPATTTTKTTRKKKSVKIPTSTTSRNIKLGIKNNYNNNSLHYHHLHKQTNLDSEKNLEMSPQTKNNKGAINGRNLSTISTSNTTSTSTSNTTSNTNGSNSVARTNRNFSIDKIVPISFNVPVKPREIINVETPSFRESNLDYESNDGYREMPESDYRGKWNDDFDQDEYCRLLLEQHEIKDNLDIEQQQQQQHQQNISPPIAASSSSMTATTTTTTLMSTPTKPTISIEQLSSSSTPLRATRRSFDINTI